MKSALLRVRRAAQVVDWSSFTPLEDAQGDHVSSKVEEFRLAERVASWQACFGQGLDIAVGFVCDKLLLFSSFDVSPGRRRGQPGEL